MGSQRLTLSELGKRDLVHSAVRSPEPRWSLPAENENGRLRGSESLEEEKAVPSEVKSSPLVFSVAFGITEKHSKR